jgi:hypothetical protein
MFLSLSNRLVNSYTAQPSPLREGEIKDPVGHAEALIRNLKQNLEDAKSHKGKGGEAARGVIELKLKSTS